MAKEVSASGHGRLSGDSGRRTGETYLQRRVSNSERGGPTARPARAGQAAVEVAAGVGAAIVVGDGERPSQGEGPQGLERNLSVRNPQGSIL